MGEGSRAFGKLFLVYEKYQEDQTASQPATWSEEKDEQLGAHKCLTSVNVFVDSDKKLTE